MADGNKKICHRSGSVILPLDPQIEFCGLHFHKQKFTCKATGTKLTLKTANKHVDGEVYLKGKEPFVEAYQGKDVIDERVIVVPDSNMRTTDRTLNYQSKQAERGYAPEKDAGSALGPNSVTGMTVANVPDSNMRTSDRIFQTASNQAARGFQQAETVKSSYGDGALGVERQTTVDKPPVTVNNINQQEKRWNGVDKYTGVE